MLIRLFRRLNDRAFGPIEDQLPAGLLAEVEHVHDRTGQALVIEGALTEPLTVQPVVLDELRDRGLCGEHMADEVLLGVGRDHQEWLTHASTAASVHPLAMDARWQRGAGRPWDAAIAIAVYRFGQRLLYAAFYYRDLRERCPRRRLGEDVIVPAVRVVIRNDHSRRIPVRLFLKEVDQIDHTRLLVKRIGFVTIWVGVLERRQLDERYRRVVTCTHRREEVLNVIAQRDRSPLH